jgi:predicted GIY-YIG superfamily endonuclease
MRNGDILSYDVKKGIYKIQNQINNKVYIGSSIDINRRWQHHKDAAFNINAH